MRDLSRRDLIRLGLLSAGAAMLPATELVRWAERATSQGSQPNSPHFTPFSQPLFIPPVIEPLASDATTDFYAVYQQVVVKEIFPGKKTTLWTYGSRPPIGSYPGNGSLPGPTFRVRRHRSAVVKQINLLTAPNVFTTTHLHGGRLLPDSDGDPVELVPPGPVPTLTVPFPRDDTTLPPNVHKHYYPNVQPATTLWYHDHAIHETGRNVWMGLAGFYLISDEHEDSLNLPKGDFEVPLVIQDRAFNPDGSLIYTPERQGAFGDVILVNGVPKPFFNVFPRKYRFRILNGSNARFYNLRLSTGDPMTVIGSEGGLLPRKVPTTELFIVQAERYDVIIDFSVYKPDTKVTLQNTIAPDPFGDPVNPDLVRDIMQFVVVPGGGKDTSSVPDFLADPADLPVLPPPDTPTTRTFRFNRSGGQWTINDLPFDNNRIDAATTPDASEIWEFENSSGGWLHPIHPHLVQYRVLSRDDQPPRPYETGVKDTVSLGPNETVRVWISRAPIAGASDANGFSANPSGFQLPAPLTGQGQRMPSNPARYVFHCHNIEHEDDDMMTRFEVKFGPSV